MPRYRLHVQALELVPLDPEPPLAPALPETRREQREVIRRNRVDRASHEGRLDGAPLLQRLRQGVPAKVPQARPEPDVRRGRVLRLQPGEALEGRGERNRRALEQKLTSQQCPVEVAGR